MQWVTRNSITAANATITAEYVTSKGSYHLGTDGVLRFNSCLGSEVPSLFQEFEHVQDFNCSLCFKNSATFKNLGIFISLRITPCSGVQPASMFQDLQHVQALMHVQEKCIFCISGFTLCPREMHIFYFRSSTMFKPTKKTTYNVLHFKR